MYADDLVIFSSSREGLKKSLDASVDFFSKWNLNINYDKTKCITFNKRGDKGKHVFKINGNPIENVKSYKYLGIHISSKNCFLQRLECKIKSGPFQPQNKFKPDENAHPITIVNLRRNGCTNFALWS